MTGRRELGGWIAVVVLGCVLALLAAGRPWVTRASGSAPLTGDDLTPVLTPLALAVLAGTVAVLATRGPGRRLIGALIALCGVGAAAAALTAAGTNTVWPYVATAGAVLMTAAGVLAVLRGGRWGGMSGRYDRPGSSAARPADDRSLWDALDRGDDPTSDLKEH